MVIDTDTVLDHHPCSANPITCGLHANVAYCLYREVAGPTAFTVRTADGSVIASGTP